VSFWATHDWHVAHCMFYWLKYTRMRDTGKIMERRFDTIGHVKHCRHLAMKKPRTDGKRVLIEVTVVMNASLETEHG
jgi:hypothetical protein